MAKMSKAEIRARAIRALELRIAGLSLQEIADELKFNSDKSVWKAINDLQNRQERETVTSYRQYQLARLDQALTSIWPKVLKGDKLAIDAFLKIEDRRAKLMGMDAPRLIAPVTPSGDILPMHVQVYIPDNKRG